MNFLAKRIKGKSLWAEASRRLLRDRFAVASIIVIVLYTAIAFLVWSNVLLSDWKNEIGTSRLEPTLGQGWKYWLGLDLFGRSLAAKAIAATKTAMYVGFGSSLIAVSIGVFFGALAGYFGGWIDDLITWVCAVLSNIPSIFLVVAIAFALGRGIENMIVALGVTNWVGMARIVRAEFIRHKGRDYVSAAAALGAGHARRIWIHIFPNVLHVVIISFSLQFVTAIKSEVILTYLGLGVETGAASWGTMIDDAKGELMQGLWGGLVGATLGMFFIVLAVSIFADSLRDAMDPKLKV